MPSLFEELEASSVRTTIVCERNRWLSLREPRRRSPRRPAFQQALVTRTARWASQASRTTNLPSARKLPGHRLVVASRGFGNHGACSTDAVYRAPTTADETTGRPPVRLLMSTSGLPTGTSSSEGRPTETATSPHWSVRDDARTPSAPGWSCPFWGDGVTLLTLGRHHAVRRRVGYSIWPAHARLGIALRSDADQHAQGHQLIRRARAARTAT